MQRTFAAGTPEPAARDQRAHRPGVHPQIGPVSRAQIARSIRRCRSRRSRRRSRRSRRPPRSARRAVRPAARVRPPCCTSSTPRRGWSGSTSAARACGRRSPTSTGADRAPGPRARPDVEREGLDRRRSAGRSRRWRRTRGSGWREVTVACIGSPGVFADDEDQPRLPHNLPGGAGPGCSRRSARELGTHVLFENDVNLAALGEQPIRPRAGRRGLRVSAHRHRGRHGHRDRRRALPGANGSGGRGRLSPAGHQRSARSRLPTAWSARIGDRGRSVVKSARDAGLRRSGLTAEQVVDAARRGDARAQGVVRELGARIGLALAAIVSVLDPALVILGGGSAATATSCSSRSSRSWRRWRPSTRPWWCRSSARMRNCWARSRWRSALHRSACSRERR